MATNCAPRAPVRSQKCRKKLSLSWVVPDLLEMRNRVRARSARLLNRVTAPGLLGDTQAPRLHGRELSLDAFRNACRRAEKARAAAREWAGGFDAILTLPAPGQAPHGLASTGSAVFNALWTQLYMPCLTLPAGHGPNGLPVGVQLVCRRHDDARLLEVGLWVEHRLGQGDRP